MGKKRHVADGRGDKEFMFEVEEEVLEDPPWSTPYNSDDEYYRTKPPYIQLSDSRHPRPAPPKDTDATATTSKRHVDPEPAPQTSRGDDELPQGPSRKERKRMAARERAKRVKTLADVVVEEGRVIDESEYVADPAMAFPIADLPLDIVRDVLLFYIDVPTIVNAMAASRGFRAMMADDLLWRDVFRMHSLEQLDRKLWKRIRNRTKTWSQKSMLMTHVINPYASPQEQKALMLREQHRQEMQRTEESAELRRMLKQRTDDWDEIEEQFYVHCRTGHVSTSHSQPMEKQTISYRWSKCQFVYYHPDYNYFKQYVRKSEALRTQYECSHARVGFSKERHQVFCLVCGLCTHVATVPRNVYVF